MAAWRAPVGNSFAAASNNSRNAWRILASCAMTIDGRLPDMVRPDSVAVSRQIFATSMERGASSPLGGVDSRKNVSKMRAIRRSSISIAAAYSCTFASSEPSVSLRIRIRSSSRLRTATLSGVLRSCAVSPLRRKLVRAKRSSQRSIRLILPMDVDHRDRLFEFALDDGELRIVRRKIGHPFFRLFALLLRFRRIDLFGQEATLGEHDDAIRQHFSETPRDDKTIDRTAFAVTHLPDLEQREQRRVTGKDADLAVACRQFNLV